MAWSMPTSGQWNSGVPIVANANSMGSYTQEQWSVMQQQQNWQWAQWQQQYGQWPNQYGDEYAQQMQAMQMVGMAGMPPLPPANAAVPPAPPPPDHPPPPLPHENNQPLYGQSQAKQPPPPAPVQAAHTIARAPVQASHTPAYAPRTPVPAPVPAPPKGDPTNDNYGNYNYVNQQGNNQTRAHQPNSFNNNTSTVPAKGKADEKDELSEEEILFDIQFKKWEEEIEKWRKDNVNHPDKRSYMEYEERFKTCRDQLMERRKQMKLKRDLKLANKSANNLGPNTDNKTSATIGSNSAMTSANTRIPTITTIPTNATLNQHKPPSQSYNKPPISYSENNSQYQQFNNRQHGQGYNNKNNISIDTSQPVNKYDALNNDATNMYPSQMEPLNSTNFLPTSASTKEIPGLDLVPSDNPSLPQQEVIDITEDQNNAEHPKFPQGPDYSTISKGISNILGDEKIMNILSMVRVGQNEPNRNPPQKNAPNNQWDNRQQSQENQQHYGNRQQPYNNRQSQVQEPSDQFQNQYYNNSQDYYNDNSQFGNNQNMPPKPIQPPYQNMPPRQGSSNFNNQNTNAPPRLLDLKFNDQIVNRQPTATGGQYGDRQFGDPNSNSGGRPQFNGQNMAALTSRPPPFANQNMPPRGPPHLNRPLDMDQDNSYGRDPHTGIAHEPPKPKPAWVEEPLFTPSIIVEYDHKPLRLKARDFIEPVHMFDYNHTSKDEGTKKKDFDKEVDGLFPELEQENNHRAQFDRPAWEHGRSYPLEEFRQRGPPRDPYDDRRRPDDRYDDRDRHRREDRDRNRDYHRDRPREARDDLFGTRRDDRRGEEFRRGEDFRRSEDLRRGEDFRREEEFRRGEDFRRGDDFRRGEDFRRAEDIRRGDDLRKGDSRRDDLRRDDHRREDSRRDSYKRDDSRKRSISHDRESRKRGKSRESETSATSVVKSEAADTPAPRHVVMIDDILEPPGREMRPDKIVIILRGLPGSGKSYLAKLIRDKEAEFGSTARIMSIDDYFMQEGEVEEKDPATGKMVKKPTLKYEYDEKSEEVYVTCLKRAFKRSLTDGYFNFLIYDAVNDQLKSYADIWNFARQQGFQVYVCTLELDAKACHKRNIHNRTLEEIEVITARFFPTPAHHIQIDPTTLLQNAAIPDVQMEDAMDDVIMLDDDAEDEVENSFTSKWEKMDDATKLARLDGTSKPLRPSQLSMEDYLQLDDWKPTSAKPGKKTVRWADLEERNKQEKMRAIGFVVGQTDWNRMTDPTMGSSALTQTKYIERVRRN